ncbi:MAG: hypothetical protein A2751_01525 [Candidatus Doudnabacteria bacterium RIFCSPHIGHO2_01_FULL_46_14]|uniref:Type II secretion system protein n=1 Tax=Candidatus Doudnabacteria bacterium RIFCSPHIGHO2_01_FULL_46_14 TaxID=1817824 RepID=A0A1F5NPC0_9BACT|nr:MAG: hypothetical protein A2751_01525 [Candidatus Doudnabacteria bacterium RIFCSPHIGHO2_01_FULL_46_14]
MFFNRSSLIAHRSSAASQRGQTLIETVVALFILTTGLAAGLTLAVYALSSSSVSSNKVLASALAREGLEGVRRMRDSNWLAGNLNDCNGQICYANWLSQVYNITGSGSGTTYRLMFNPSSFDAGKWTLAPAGVGTDYRLYLYGGSGYTHVYNGWHSSPFFRQIIITNQSTASPYDATSPLMSVKSIVWWWDENCPMELSNPALTVCKVVAEEYLTNWKNY